MAKQAEVQRDRRCRVIVPDQLEFIVGRHAGVHEEIGDDSDNSRAAGSPASDCRIIQAPESSNKMVARSVGRRTREPV